MYKKLYNSLFVLYLAFFVLAILFWQERTAFTDIAFHLFFIVRHHEFPVQNFRFGAVLTQLYPFLATKLSLPLGSIMMSYSIGFIFYYFLCYFFCGVVLKDYKMGLVLLLSQVLFVSHTFYWMQSELPQAIAFCTVFFAFLNKYSHIENTFARLVSWLWILFSIITLGFFHPLLMFPFSFILFFFLSRKEGSIDWKMLVAAAILFAAVLFVKKTYYKTAYDEQAMEGAKKLISQFPHYFRIYSNKRFLKNCLTVYYWIPVISLIITAVYIKQGKWRSLVLFGAYMLAFLLLVNISYQDPATTTFYLENLYLPLGIFLAVPLVYDILPALRIKHVYILIAVIAITGVVRIFGTHTIYTRRLNAEKALMAKYDNRKTIIKASLLPNDTFMMTWGIPYEAWLLSTSAHNKAASLAALDDPFQFKEATSDTKVFITAWEAVNYQYLPAKYFPFKDTSTVYQIIDK